MSEHDAAFEAAWAAQSDTPSWFLQLTRRFFDAGWSAAEAQQAKLRLDEQKRIVAAAIDAELAAARDAT